MFSVAEAYWPDPPSPTGENFLSFIHSVSGGKGWFPLVSGEEGLVSAGFRVGRTCFGWFQGGKDWFRVGRTGFGWFRLVPLFSNYPLTLQSRHQGQGLA